MIIYTDFMPKRFQGYNLGPITLIRPAYRLDLGLQAHEEIHRKQFWRNPFMGLWYCFSAKARLAYEVEAYREQLKYKPDSSLVFAGYLAENYGLTISRHDAWTLLTKPSA